MTEMINVKKLLLPFLIIVAAVLVSFAVLARAQEAQGIPAGPTEEEIAASGIAFPVPELGNCADKNACKAYCNDPGNMDTCIAFAKTRGLMNGEEADRAQKFSKTLQSGGGPGGCKSPAECDAFCSDISNIEACVTFAEDHGITDRNLEDGKKVLQYVKGGGKFPGGCTSKESCQTYCEDFSHIEECSNFAEKSGLGPPPGEKNGPRGGSPPSLENIKKIAQLIKNGETPGGCKSKSECDSYCSDSSHVDACVSFGIKAGFINPEEAEMIKKTGGKGPDGCNSKESCDTFCNDHREECFKFAEEHNMISPEELARAKQGMVQLRAGIEQAPPEVRECLKATMGQNIIEEIQSGKLTPGPQIGDKVRDCFDKFGHGGGPQEMFKNAPPEVISCLKEKLGDTFAKIQNSEEMPTPEMADAFRVCFQSAQFEKGGFEGMMGGPGGGGGRGPGMMGGQGGPPANGGFQNFLRSAPPGVASCLSEKLGSDFEKIKSGESQPTQETGTKMKECFGQFRPENDMRPPFDPTQGKPMNQGGENFGPPRDDQGAGSGVPQGRMPGFNMLQSVPPQVQECVRGAVGSEVFEKIQQGEVPAGDIGSRIKGCYDQIRTNAVGAPSGEILQPGGMMPPSGTSSGQYPPAQPGATYPSPDQYQQQYQQQYQEQYKQQYDQQYPSGGTMPPPPSGTTYPSSGSYTPPSGITYPSSGSYESGGTYSAPPPSGETYSPPPSIEPAPTTSPSSFLTNRRSVLGLILTPLSPILGLFVR